MTVSRPPSPGGRIQWGEPRRVPPLAGRRGTWGNLSEGSPMRFFFLGFLFGGQKEIRPPEALIRRSAPPAPSGGRQALRQQKTANGAGAWTNTLKSNSALPAAPSETADARLAPACSPPRRCPLRFSALRTGGAGERPCRALSPISLAGEKPGRRRQRRKKNDLVKADG